MEPFSNSSISLKVALNELGGCTIRKVVVARAPPPTWEYLLALVKERFSLADQHCTLAYLEDGDRITVSSDVEVAELFASSPSVLRLELLPEPAAAVPTSSDNATNHVTEAGAPTQTGSQDAHEELFSDLGSESDDSYDSDEASSQPPAAIGAHRRRTPWELVGTDSSDDEQPPSTGFSSTQRPVLHLLKKQDLDGFVDDESDGFADDDAQVGAPRPTVISPTGVRPTVEGQDKLAMEEKLEQISLSAPTPEVEAADPTDDPLPSDSTTVDPAEDASPSPPTIPAALSAFLSAFGTRAEDFHSHVHTLLADPSPARLSALFASAPAEVPTLARGVTTEVTQLVGNLFQGFRREADGLREEFGRFREVVEEEKRVFEEAMREIKAELERSAAAAAHAEEGDADEYEVEESEEVLAERQKKHRSQKTEEKARASHQARLEQKKRKEERKASKLLKRVEREEKRAKKAAAKAGKWSAQDPAVDSERKVLPSAPLDPQTGPHRHSREHLPTGPASLAGTHESRKTSRSSQPSVTHPELVAPPLAGDFFERKLSHPNPMPGAFVPPASHPGPRTPAKYFVGPYSPLKVRSYIPDPPAFGYATPPLRPSTATRMPGSFEAQFPEASTSQLPEEWAEVAPEALRQQLGELGFDLRNLGVQVVIERVWVENRGKKMEELVDQVVVELLEG